VCPYSTPHHTSSPVQPSCFCRLPKVPVTFSSSSSALLHMRKRGRGGCTGHPYTYLFTSFTMFCTFTHACTPLHTIHVCARHKMCMRAHTITISSYIYLLSCIPPPPPASHLPYSGVLALHSGCCCCCCFSFILFILSAFFISFCNFFAFFTSDCRVSTFDISCDSGTLSFLDSSSIISDRWRR